MSELYAQAAGHDKNETLMYLYTRASWKWSNKEFDDVVDTIKNIKTPTRKKIHHSEENSQMTRKWLE